MRQWIDKFNEGGSLINQFPIGTIYFKSHQIESFGGITHDNNGNFYLPYQTIHEGGFTVGGIAVFDNNFSLIRLFLSRPIPEFPPAVYPSAIALGIGDTGYMTSFNSHSILEFNINKPDSTRVIYNDAELSANSICTDSNGDLVAAYNDFATRKSYIKKFDHTTHKVIWTITPAPHSDESLWSVACSPK